MEEQLKLNELDAGNVIALKVEDEAINILRLLLIQNQSYDNLYNSYLDRCNCKKEDNKIEHNEFFDLALFMDKRTKLDMDIANEKENIVKLTLGESYDYIKTMLAYRYNIDIESGLITIRILGEKKVNV